MLTQRQHKNTKVLLSLFAGSGYNEITAVNKYGKEMIIMAEFGENLKKVREEKGITQQTLADHLYVTRQAVSRWEGGSRYPDILTAKKMAQYLGVSLDELLSDDDMKLYVENNAILDACSSKRIQSVLVALAFMCSLVLSILYISNYLIRDELVLESESEMIKSILLTGVLGYGTYAAIRDKLNPKVAMWISALYFGCAILTGVFGGIWQKTNFVNLVLLGATALNIVFLVICVRFFSSKNTVSPIPLYVLAGIYAGLGSVNFIYGFMTDIPIEIFRDVFMIHLLALVEGILLLVLLVFMAYKLNNKRKLAAR